MDKKQLELTLDVLNGEPKVFHYFKDRYAIMLMEYFLAGESKRLRELRNSPCAALLGKDPFRNILGRLPEGELAAHHLAGHWPKATQVYLLTLGAWPKKIRRQRFSGWESNYYQTSRPGCNLVLQLNFSSRHERAYQKMRLPENLNPFSHSSHPIAEHRHTLAWARIDFDFETGEALIEEIQSDWIRLAYSHATRVERLERDENGRLRIRQQSLGRDLRAFCESPELLTQYLRSELERHRDIWAEAALAASIEFIVGTLGLRSIFYHTYETGAKLKGISTNRPPRSLYSQLPKRFCFSKSTEGPEFLKNQSCERRLRVLKSGASWFHLKLPRSTPYV